MSNKGIPVHQIVSGKLSGFIGFMPQVPRKGEYINFEGGIREVRYVLWHFDTFASAWEARVDLK